MLKRYPSAGSCNSMKASQIGKGEKVEQISPYISIIYLQVPAAQDFAQIDRDLRPVTLLEPGFYERDVKKSGCVSHRLGMASSDLYAV
jgi:hypothetical protein